MVEYEIRAHKHINEINKTPGWTGRWISMMIALTSAESWGRTRLPLDSLFDGRSLPCQGRYITPPLDHSSLKPQHPYTTSCVLAT